MDSILNNISILYVEDDDTIRLITEKFFQTMGIGTVNIAVNGRDGAIMFEEVEPDIVITDVNMPQMNGLDMSGIIKDISPDTPIIVTTTFDDSKYFLEAIEIGIDAYLIKPITDINKLKDLILKFSKIVIKHKELEEKNKILNEYKKAVDKSLIFSIYDNSGILKYANQKFIEISQYNSNEIIGIPHTQIIHPHMPKGMIEDMKKSVFESKKPWYGMLENMTKIGGTYYTEATIVPILDEHTNEIIEFMSIEVLQDLIFKI